MKDTPPEIESQFHRMLMQRSGEERLKMGCSMHATAQALIKAAASGKGPVAVKRALFLRFYGEEFGGKERKKILVALRKAAERKHIHRMELLKASKRTTRKPRDLMDLAIVKSGAIREDVEPYGAKRKSKRPRPSSG